MINTEWGFGKAGSRPSRLSRAEEATMEQHSAEWLNHFRSRGFPDARPLAAGMEGAVYLLRDGAIAKVWRLRDTAELRRLADFYADLRRAGLPFATPEIVSVDRVNGKSVTLERELRGATLADRLGEPRPVPGAAAQACVLEVLSALGSVPPSPASRALAVLDEPAGFWTGRADWTDALLALLERRVRPFVEQLRVSVEEFDRKHDRVRSLLRESTDTSALGVLHGDLVPDNILVDEELRPIGLLDFGFLSTAGDPAFDAGLTCGLFDMYGPAGDESDRLLLSLVSQKFGYDPRRLAMYRAVYAMLTSNMYSSTGQDGHYEWCCRMLNRADLVAMLDR
ncbi:MAG TPA: aminoglycoside phosphotransferase family protein [Mycobacteriales bacterium]|nr:aminoglycoside phosphotransferase family protein [Mycobacteriales bacterium]